MSIGQKAGRGFISYLLRNVLEKLMGFVAMIFLARKLSPYDFGLVSITEVLLVLISVIGTTGLSEFLLAYRKDDTEEIFKAAFWFNIIITIGVVLLFFVFVPFWSAWQHDEKIRNISWVVGGIFIFSQLQSIPKAWLSKNLMFDKQVQIQAPFIVLIPIGKIISVFMGLGVYSLILPTLIFQPLLTLLLYAKTTVRPTWHLYINRWKEIYHFTKHLMGAVVFSRITDQGDKFILAKVLGLDKLGIYNIAFQLAELFTSQPVQISNNVLSSVLPKYTDNKQIFYKHYISFLKTFSFFMLPLLAIIFIGAEPIILFLYGAKWIDAVLPLQILIIAAAFKAVSSSYGSVMNSFHLNKKSFFTTVIYTPFHLCASFFGSMFGVAGLAAGVTLVKIIFINWNIRQVMSALSMRFSEWYAEMLLFFAVNIILAFCISVMIAIYPVQIIPIVSIIIIALLFLFIYTMLFRVAFKKQLYPISSFLNGTFPRLTPYFNSVFNL